MRGESLVHWLVVLSIGMLGLGIMVNYGGFILRLVDVVAIVSIVVPATILTTLLMYMTETKYRNFDDEIFDRNGLEVFIENIWLYTLISRLVFCFVAVIFGGTVWSLGILVDSVFIYILAVWGYVVITLALTFADIYYKMVIKKG